MLSNFIDRSFILRGLLAIGSSLLILALLFHLIAQSGEEVNLASLTGIVRNTAPGALLIYAVLHLINTLFRALRFQLLLRAAGEERLPSLPTLYWITMVRNMAVDLFPSRLGELVYVAMLNRASKTRVSTGLTSLLFSTLLDVAILLPVVLALSIWFVTGEAMQQHLLVGGLILTVVLIFFLFFVIKLLPPVVDWVDQRYGGRTVLRTPIRFIKELTTAIQLTVRKGVFTRAVLLTVAIRLLKYSALYVLFSGVVNANFPDLNVVDPASALSMLISAEAGASLPVPAFMSFGSWEAGGLAALTVLGFSPDESILALLALHINSQLIDYAMGAFALGVFLMTVNRGVEKRRTKAGVWSLTAGMLALVIAFAVLIFGYNEFKAVQYQTPPKAGVVRAASVASDDQSLAPLDKVEGFIVWSSNRSGNHDIMRMDLPSREVRRLTKHPNTETYPRISPDGRQLVFARSHKEWQSLRNVLLWDIYLLDLRTGKERLLAENGMWPTWSGDGRFVYYQQKLKELVRHEIDTGKEKVAYRSGQDGIPPKTEIQTPSIHPQDGTLAVTLRKGARRISVVPKGGPIQNIRGRDACQLTWAPSGTFTFHVGHGGKQKNAIFISQSGSDKYEKWFDMPGDYSHEYFPRLSQKEKYLVFGSSTGGHEHDVADYEIFVWKVGADPASAARLTFHTGNDNWPDIYLTKE